jgi:hypothetical protein
MSFESGRRVMRERVRVRPAGEASSGALVAAARNFVAAVAPAARPRA